MKSDQDMSGFLEDALGSITKLGVASTVPVVTKNSASVDMYKVIDDCVYGLLSQEALEPEQVALLSALMRRY